MKSIDVEAAHAWPPKHPNDKLDYYVNFERHVARAWQPWTDFPAATRIRIYVSGLPAGFEFESSGGRSSGRQPIWPEIIGRTVQDGSITWTCSALSSASLRTTIVGTPTWTADTGLVITGESITDSIASAFIASGTNDQNYTVLVNAVFADGTNKAVVCILPVHTAIRVCDY